MKFKHVDWVAMLALACPFVYLYYSYNNLPTQVAVHWGLDGKPNGWEAKDHLWITLLWISCIGIGIYWLFRFITKIDPKKKTSLSQDIFDKLGFVIALFVAGINGFMLYSAQSITLEFSRFIPIITALLLSIIGNLMYNLKPNYFLGIRTPWTLESEDNWKNTHRLASKLWFAGGLIAALAIILLPIESGFVVFMVIVGILAIIPVGYSFYLFKQSQKQSS